MNLDLRAQAQDDLTHAQAALRAGYVAAAADHLRALRARCPDAAEGLALQAELDLQSDQPQQALAALDAHDQYHPARRSDPQVALLRARALVRCGMDELAAELLTHLTHRFPDDARVWPLLGAVQTRRGQTRPAISSYREALRLAPSDSTARRALAALLAATDPQAGAVVLLAGRPGAVSDPDLLHAARMLNGAGRQREAEDTYRDLLERHPDDAPLWREAGALADALGSDDLARARLERAVARGGAEQPKALAALALAHQHAGRLHAAGRCWWRLTRRDPRPVAPWAGLLVCALATGKRRLIQYAQHALPLYGTPAERRRTLARMWFHTTRGRTGDATAPSAATAASADDTTARQTAAPSPLKLLLQQAARALDRHTRQWPRRADIHYHLAICQRELGDAAAATTAAKAALSINPRYISAARLAHELGVPLAEAA